MWGKWGKQQLWLKPGLPKKTESLQRYNIILLGIQTIQRTLDTQQCSGNLLAALSKAESFLYTFGLLHCKCKTKKW